MERTVAARASPIECRVRLLGFPSGSLLAAVGMRGKLSRHEAGYALGWIALQYHQARRSVITEGCRHGVCLTMLKGVMSRVAVAGELLFDEYSEVLRLPNGSVVRTDREPISLQEWHDGRWMHEALVRSGVIQDAIASTSATRVVVKSRMAGRSSSAKSDHNNEIAALDLLAGRDGLCAIPEVLGAWIEPDALNHDERLHIVMTRIPGMTLRELAGGQHSRARAARHEYLEWPISVVQIVQVFEAVNQRLVQLHEADWLLNDINLGSILVDTDASGIKVGLVDFGQASPRRRPTAPGWGQHYPSEILEAPPSPGRDTAILAATLRLAVEEFGGRQWKAEEEHVQTLLAGCMHKQHPASAFASSLRLWRQDMEASRGQ
jgi:hypothetical protein